MGLTNCQPYNIIILTKGKEVINMKYNKRIEKMMDMVIRKCGFEAEETISFCRMCENYPMVTIEEMFLSIMES